MEERDVKYEKTLPDGREVEKHLDDVTPPKGGGGGTATPSRPDGYMETWDVVQFPHVAHGKPLPDDKDEDDWPQK